MNVRERRKRRIRIHAGRSQGEREPPLSRLLRGAQRARWPWIAAVGLCFLVGFVLLVLPRTARVHIQAETEVLALEVSGGEPLGWPVDGMKLLDRDGLRRERSSARVLEAEQRLVLAPGLRVEITRAQKSAELAIRVSPPDLPGAGGGTQGPAATDVAHLRQGGGGAVAVPLPLVLTWLPAGSPAVILQLRGRAAVGEDVAPGVRHVLLSGRIRILEPTWLGRWHEDWREAPTYENSTYELASGDRIVPRGVLHGFARIAPDEPMTVVLFGAAGAVDVVRYGGAPVELTASFWSRAANEPLAGLLFAFGAAIGAVAQFVWQSPGSK
jgi:hypothetical protein